MTGSHAARLAGRLAECDNARTDWLCATDHVIHASLHQTCTTNPRNSLPPRSAASVHPCAGCSGSVKCHCWLLALLKPHTLPASCVWVCACDTACCCMRRPFLPVAAVQAAELAACAKVGRSCETAAHNIRVRNWGHPTYHSPGPLMPTASAAATQCSAAAVTAARGVAHSI